MNSAPVWRNRVRETSGQREPGADATALPAGVLQSIGAVLLRMLQATQTRALLLAAVGALLLAILPSGWLSGNEEQYLAEAYRSVAPQDWPQQSNLLGGFPHAFVFNELLGHLIVAVDFPAAQFIGRMLAIALYAVGLARLFAFLQLQVLDLLIVVTAFVVAGEGLVGDEWMFRGIEPKVLAYGFVLLALTEFLKGRSALCFGLLLIAVHLHALVGGLWAAIFFAAFMVLGAPRRRIVVLHAAVAAVLLVPYGIFLMRQGYAQFDTFVESAGPPVGWILTYVAYPWHTTPFIDIKSFLKWTPGLVATLAIGIAAAFAIGRMRDRSAQRLACLVALSAGWVMMALLLTYVFDDGRFGPYLLFRPSSMNLLLALLLLVCALRQLPAAADPWLRLGMLAVLLLVFSQTVLHLRVSPVGRELLQQAEQRELIDWVSSKTRPDSVFLIETGIEHRFFDFERSTRRASFFFHRFTPGSSADIREWYRRYLLRERVVATGCASAKTELRIDYLIASAETADRLAGTCGSTTHESGGFRVVEFRRHG